MRSVRNHFVEFAERNVVTFRSSEHSPTAGPGQALLRTRYSVISPGTELARLHGTIMPGRSGKALTYPMTTGSAVVADVVESGAPDLVQPGDRLVASRPHALYNTIRLDDTNGWARIPEGLSDEEAALAVFLQIGLTAALCVEVRFAYRVLVLGQGLIGYCAAQWFNLTPALEVIAADLLDTRLSFARERGIDARPAAEVAELARSRPFDIVVEATGAPPVVLEAFDSVREGGAVVLLGTPRGRLSDFDVTNLIHRHPAVVYGAHGSTHGMNVVGAPGLAISRSLALCLDYIARGRVRVDGLVGAVLAPSEAAQAFATVERRGLYTVGLDWTKERFEP
jgi:threonine dehydrogenase-like Zn-dependent dehydrogenase